MDQIDGSVEKTAKDDVGTTNMLAGIWSEPFSRDISKDSTRSETALLHESSPPTIVNGDGRAVSQDDISTLAGTSYKLSAGEPIQLASMNLAGAEFIQVADRSSASQRRSNTASTIQQIALDARGESKYGNKVPSNAREFANMVVEKNVQCASTTSEWLIEAGLMTNSDYKIRVKDLMDLLPNKGFRRVNLTGNLDTSAFPEGPIGFIAGTGNKADNSNHIGYVEKRGNELFIIHNDFRTGKVVEQNIKQKFYNADGKPQYDRLALFLFPR